MRRYLPRHWRQWVGAGASFLVPAIVLALAIAYSGLYDVSARASHFGPVFGFLQLTKNRSIAAHTDEVDEPPPIGEAALVARGAAHYDRVHSFCHAAPGQPRSPTVRQMLPQPPLLGELVQNRSAEELFWVVQNGLKYSGMPGWPVEGRTDEVWATVSFIETLQGMSASSYRELVWTSSAEAAGPAAGADRGSNGTEMINARAGHVGGAPDELATCTQCDGPIAAGLSDEDMAELAAYYSRQPVEGAPAAGDVPPALIEEGRQIHEAGIAESDVTSCASCHGILDGERSGAQVYPQLAGQYADYTATQLFAWRYGNRGGVRPGESMQNLAHDLSNEAILAVAAYYASLSPDSQAPGEEGG